MNNLIPEKEFSNEELITSLIESYWVSVKKLAFTYVKDWVLAEDITQEVFIKCYKNLDQFRRESSYKTWLYRVTVNRCKDELKSKWFKTLWIFEEVKDKVGKNIASAEISYFKNYEETVISELVLALPVKYREVIILYYYEELSLEEIQILLGLNINTIKTRLRRGKMLLKKVYERNGD
ncbi:sigma-70 family RNA polymerase sigma factor [Cytobacillus oceanisediminis]|uniref:sigma-70 family RNA polymerase sigma factor n=1 Tax=Cytobacillus oceanisediminis TaxID=665099 RepID=UPI0025505232|nr:sigma-70 family RNA polymerase sigma factor [Cytobacillus oceanisediminis]MDK7669169.1 sigma-70 family RNA polymerase sigma factor [Cytobacillus oceanisediminis]